MFEIEQPPVRNRTIRDWPIWQPSQYRAELIISHSIVVGYALYMLRGFVPGSPIRVS